MEHSRRTGVLRLELLNEIRKLAPWKRRVVPHFLSFVLLRQQLVEVAESPVLIAVYGDSTIYGWSKIGAGYARVEQPAPAILQSLLREKFGNSVTVANHGVNGSTAGNLLDGDGTNLPWDREMRASQAKIIVLAFGINDSKVESKESVAQFGLIEDRLIRIAKSHGKTVILETSNPVNFAPCAALPLYAKETVDVGRRNSVPVIDQYGHLSHLDWFLLTSDGAHPAQSGYRVKAEYEFKYVAPIFESLTR